MPYNITCCKCKEQIPIQDGNSEMFFMVQPAKLEDNDWKRVKYGGFKQLMICKKCIFGKKKRKLRRKKNGK